MRLCGISSDFSLLSPSIRQVTHVLLTRPPLDNASSGRSFPIRISFDLHVLGTPPAFILSQDRTLIKSAFLTKSIIRSSEGLSSVQVKTRLACFSFLLLKFVFAAHFCASEFSLPELRLFVLLRRTSFQESSGSVYYSIFDFQGSILQKVFRFILAKALIFLAFFLLFAVLFFATACVS